MSTSRTYEGASSIYRTVDEGPVSEFSIHPKFGRSTRRGAEPSPPPEATYQDLRVANPNTEPLPITFKWIARLPANVRPLQLLRQHPRIANTLAANWVDPAAFRACLYDLLVDKRGNRRGFPAVVRGELLALHQYMERCCPRSPR